MTRILLVRHCEARGNVDRVFQGHTDADISENGQRQLERLSERFRDIAFDVLYSSPLIRAQKTALAANLYHNLPLQLHPGLIEINGGRMEGQRWADFPVLFPEVAHSWNRSPHAVVMPDGESMRCVSDRIWAAVCEIVSENTGKTVCVASHGAAIRCLLCRAKELPFEQLNDVDWCDNTGVSVIDFDATGRPAVILENDISHLDESLSTFAKQTWWRERNASHQRFE